MKYNNPWVNDPDFVDLGDFTIRDSNKVTHFDLYALVHRSGIEVSFGARYSSVDSEYMSGTAFKKQNGHWELYISGPVAIAAARYFANHHKGG